MTVSCQLSVSLSAVGVGLPYSLHRTFHVLPSRPLCGAGARFTFTCQGATLSGVQPLSGLSVMQGNLLWSVFVPLTVLIVPQCFPLVKCFFQKFLNFFRLPCGLSCVVLWSISDYRITQGCKLVKYFFQKIRKKIGGKNLLCFFN